MLCKGLKKVLESYSEAEKAEPSPTHEVENMWFERL